MATPAVTHPNNLSALLTVFADQAPGSWSAEIGPLPC